MQVTRFCLLNSKHYNWYYWQMRSGNPSYTSHFAASGALAEIGTGERATGGGRHHQGGEHWSFDSELHKTTSHGFCIDNIHAGDEQCDCAVLPGSDCSPQRTGSAFVQQGSADAETRLVRDWIVSKREFAEKKTSFSVCGLNNFGVVRQAKFLFMVRDGRATVNSIISRKVTITGFDFSSWRQCMIKWNHAIETMHHQCKEIGSDQCMMVSDSQLEVGKFESNKSAPRCTTSSWCCTRKSGCEKYWNSLRCRGTSPFCITTNT